MIIKLPFSKQPKVRQMQRELQATKKKLRVLSAKVVRHQLRQCKSVATPEKEARQLCLQGSITPTTKRVKLLTPYTQTMAVLRHSSSKVKKHLFTPSQKFKKGCAKTIARKIKMCRDYVFHRKKKGGSKRPGLSAHKRALVIDFLKRADNSYELPGVKDRPRGVQKYSLTDTMSNLHTKFRAENPDLAMSMSSFCAARPKSVRLVTYTQRYVCLCHLHANVDLMATAAKVLPRSGQFLCSLTNTEIKDRLSEAPDRISYKIWETGTMIHNGKEIKKVLLQDREENKEEFTKKFLKLMDTFRPHCARVREIYEQLRHLKSTMGPSECVVQVDYSENWCHKYMNEISSVYYNNQQLSIFPMVMYYHAADGDGIQHKSFAGITEETAHTAPTTVAFIKALISNAKVLVPGLTCIHFLSDSPSSQFRNKRICKFMRMLSTLIGISLTWTWMESGHGKGPCDGAGGSLKKAADNVVKSNQVIRSREEFWNVMEQRNLQITLIQISREAIQDIANEMLTWEDDKVDGIMKLHIFVNVDGKSMVRETPCFKSCCYSPGPVFKFSCPGWRPAYKPGANEVDPTSLDNGQVAVAKNGGEVDGDLGVAKNKAKVDENHAVEPEVIMAANILLNISDDFQKEQEVDSDKEPKTWNVGNSVSVRYGRKFYVAKITAVDGQNLHVSYMTPCRGKWKWGQRDEGIITQEEILCELAEPHHVGNLLDIQEYEKKQSTEKMSQN